jgi:AcrR family transcriptional regulator
VHSESAAASAPEVGPGRGPGGNTPGDDATWRERAVARSLDAARSRAEDRVQRFIDAAFALIDEKGTTEFTIQEVIDRSKQSLRSFYQYFGSKDELLLALLEESGREAADDLDRVVAAESDPLERLHVFVVRLHEWCDDTHGARGTHYRPPISEFSTSLALTHPTQVAAAMSPVSTRLHALLEAAADSGAVTVSHPWRTVALVQQTVMLSWFGNRLASDPRRRVTAEETWRFCLRGLSG